MANKIVPYIFGKWAKFIVVFFTCLVTIVGITFIGGNLVTTNIKHDSSSYPNTDALPNISVYVLYFQFLYLSWEILKYVINEKTSFIISYLHDLYIQNNSLTNIFILFILPIFMNMGLPLLYPIILCLLGLGLATTSFTGGYEYFLFPPSEGWFYESCEFGEDDGWFMSMWKCLVYIFVFIKTCILFVFNIMAWGGIAWAGCFYLLWTLLGKPLANYKEIIKNILHHSTLLLVSVVLSYFLSCFLYLGIPLKYASVGILIVSLFLVFFEYVKQRYLSLKKA